MNNTEKKCQVINLYGYAYVYVNINVYTYYVIIIYCKII